MGQVFFDDEKAVRISSFEICCGRGRGQIRLHLCSAEVRACSQSSVRSPVTCNNLSKVPIRSPFIARDHVL